MEKNTNSYDNKVEIKVLYGNSNFKRTAKTWDKHMQLKKKLEDATHLYANKSIELEQLMKSKEGMFDKTVTGMNYITGKISDENFNKKTNHQNVIKQASIESAQSLNNLINVVAECSEKGMDDNLVYQTRMDVFKQHGMKV